MTCMSSRRWTVRQSSWPVVQKCSFSRKWGCMSKMHGAKVITTKWLDTNKGDADSPNYRSRLVGREVKYDKRLDMFSATPPLETLKVLISMCARRQHEREPCRMAVVDIKRAYFYAKARRPVFIAIPIED